MGTNYLLEDAVPERGGRCAADEPVSLFFTDFTVTVIPAVPVTVRTGAEGHPECIMLLLSGSAVLTEAGLHTELRGHENGVFFGGTPPNGVRSVELREATAVFCTFPGGITAALERWGIPGLQIPCGALGSSLLNNAAAHFFHDLVLSHAGEPDEPGVSGSETISGGPIFEAARGMLVALVESNLRQKNAEMRPDTRERALAMVREYGLDPELTVGIIAERLHVSMRQLQRSFADGTPLSMVLLRHRALHAGNLLAAPEFAELTLAGIAKRSGFSGVKTLRRAVLEVFGKSPQQLRGEVIE